MLQLDIVHRPNQSYLRPSWDVKDKIRTLDEIGGPFGGLVARSIRGLIGYLSGGVWVPREICTRNITHVFPVTIGDWINNLPVTASSL
jgi:hypothetical protein